MIPVRRIAAAVAVVGCVTAAAIAELDLPLRSAGPIPSAPIPSTPSSSSTPAPPGPIRIDAAGAYPAQSQIEEWLGSLERGVAPRAVLVDDRYLYDGRHKVRLPSGDKRWGAWPYGRVPGGWFVGLSTGRYTGQYGVLKDSGSFKVLASGVLRGAALSPEGTRMAMAVIPTGGKPRASVANVRTGKVVSTTTIGPTAYIAGWNPSGIWLSSMPDPNLTSLTSARWIPGKPVQELRQRASPWSRTTDRMIGRTDDCEKIVTLGPRGFSTIAEYCGFDGATGLLSPDGMVFVTPDQVARTIGTDRKVQLEFMRGLSFGDTAWEDARHVLLSVDLEKPVTAHKRTIVRCDIGSGDCERAYATNQHVQFVAP